MTGKLVEVRKVGFFVRCYIYVLAKGAMLLGRMFPSSYVTFNIKLTGDVQEDDARQEFLDSILKGTELVNYVENCRKELDRKLLNNKRRYEDE